MIQIKMEVKMRVVLLLVLSAGVAFAPVSDADQASFLDGQVAIDTTSTGEILVALDEAPADGDADVLFVLQQEAPFETVSAYLDHARVLVRDDQVRIEGGEVALSLVLEGNKARLTPPRERWQVVEGFGLSRSWGGGFGVPVEVAASEAHYHQGEAALKGGPPEKPDGGDDVCTSGGPNATSCTVGGCEGSPSTCSVSCGSPKYACCWCESIWPRRAMCKCRP